MTSKKTTRRALFSSIMALLLCCSMLVGTTFAWFTDSVTSTGNIIKSGTLDVEMYYGDDASSISNDASVGAIFNYDLWEPGFTQTKYVKVKNVGDLAFQYRLHIIPNAQPAAGAADLADVIDVYAAKVDATYADRSDAMDAANKIGTLSELIAKAEGTAHGTLLPEAGKGADGMVAPADAGIGETVWCITLHMQESAGNEYQNLSVGEGFAVQLLATQLTAEFDSFGNDYDTNAVWPGEIDTNWYTADPTAEEFTISTAEELAGLAALVNGTNVAPDRVVTYALANEGEASAEETVPVQESFADVTVKLGGNIDLKNMNWAPIGNWENTFEGTFDGQGYTISNLYINASEMEGVGLFGVAQNATIKGINVDNANITGYSMVGTIVGSPYTGCTISDCHVTGDIKLVAEYAYAGGISAYGYVDIDNCSVIADGTGVIMARDRNAVGGISAWSLEGDNRIINCQVKNLELTGWANIGAITGFAHYSNVIDGCSAEAITITKTRVDGHPSVGLASGGWSYNASKPITITNNSFKNIEINGTAVNVASADILYGSEYGGGLNSNFVLDNNVQENIENNLVWVTAVKTADALVEALESGEDVTLTGDVKIEPASMSNAYGTTGINVKNGQTIDGNGYTLDIKGAGGTWDSGISTTGGLIKNITVTGSFRGIFINHNSTYSERVVLENVIIDGTTYTISCDQGNNQGLTATNSTFNGWTSYAATLGDAKFVDCSFGEGNGYAFCRPYAPTEFVGCEFEAGFLVDPRAAVTFENCTLDGVAITAENISTLVTGNTANATVK